MPDTTSSSKASPPMSVPVERHRALAGASRARLLDALRRAKRPMTAMEAASAVGLHANTAREHLHRLIAAGLAQRHADPSGSRGRPQFRYEALPETGPDDPYRLLAAVLAEEIARVPDPASAIADAGDRWGQRLAELQERNGVSAEAQDGDGIDADGGRALERLIAILDGVGFAPSMPAPDAPIELHHCPFRDLAEAQGDVVCGVHLGLMRGALREMGAPLQATRLRPFVSPDLCLAEVEPDGR